MSVQSEKYSSFTEELESQMFQISVKLKIKLCEPGPWCMRRETNEKQAALCTVS